MSPPKVLLAFIWEAPQSVVTLSLLGGLRVSEIPEAMPAGVLTPGRYNHAGQALG